VRQFSLLALDLFARDDVRWLEKRLAARRDAMPLAESLLVTEGEAAPRYAFGRGASQCWSGLDHFLPSGEPAKGNTAFASDPKLKMCS
jgi:hypothetical protein